MTGSAGPPPIEWKLSQVFGEHQPEASSEDIQEADLLSALDFDESGNYFATGDRGGRIVVFERAAETPRRASDSNAQYRFLTEFQSHEPEFDYLKSLEIEEKINSIRWCRGVMGCKLLLSTNDKTIKLWKVYGKKIKAVSNMNLEASRVGGVCGGTHGVMGAPWVTAPTAAGERVLRLPQVSTCERVVTATPKRTFSNAHAYHINSIALCCDGESFLSGDDLRLNLWNLNVNTSSFTVVDLKPSSMEALSKVITSADFHPTHCSTFLYACSRGVVRIGDMRSAALCDTAMKQFEVADDPSSRSFFSEITSSISSARFSRDGRYIVTRDYLAVRVWDVQMESRPLHTFPVHEHLRPRLCDLYERDCIFDKFEACFSHDGKHLLTGSYDNCFHMLSREGPQSDVVLEASQTPYSRLPRQSRGRGASGGTESAAVDFGRRTLHAAFHPTQNLFAVAATSTLYIFNS
uniref:Serine/threonine-protein phosphatase 2A 55 kDa regulatory subunit B n=1 Tax=Calcidiscus leptoporus TaxID=127549 RepID=A0A7S0P3H7_9EUKA|mmetsp:Transcript_53467/g.122875  ORF Transcript_53467/g.122875 Transcript_53467/m.122875 type:complete len:463 (+) Transcript_53467:214-1602(+)